jgi:hypothetical protein
LLITLQERGSLIGILFWIISNLKASYLLATYFLFIWFKPASFFLKICEFYDIFGFYAILSIDLVKEFGASALAYV